MPCCHKWLAKEFSTHNIEGNRFIREQGLIEVRQTFKKREKMMKRIWHYVEDKAWIPHPIAKDVKIKNLITRKEHGADVTCMLVLIPMGKEVPEHVHREQDDILYPLKGKAKMWVDGEGFLPLEPGVIVRVPKGMKHKISEVTQDLLLYDVFSPPLV
jgi:quercetin dioxygenase-like cupin family protein